MNERGKPDLSSIAPIGRLPDDEPGPPIEEGEPVDAATVDSSDPAVPSDEERELDKLRRS